MEVSGKNRKSESDSPPAGPSPAGPPPCKKVTKYIDKLQKKEQERRKTAERKISSGSDDSAETKEERNVRRYIERLGPGHGEKHRSVRIVESSLFDTKTIQRRYILIAVSTCASFFTMALRGTINVPLVARLGEGVVFQKPSRNYSECASNFLKEIENRKKEVIKTDYGEHWDDDTIALVLSSVYIGFLLTPVLSGVLSNRYSAKGIISVALYLSGILCMLVPLAAARDAGWALVLVRIGQGACLGLIPPAVMTLFARWLPPDEVSFLNAINFAGMIVGYMIGSSGSEVLADYGPWGGWPSIFYLYGSATEIFCCLWIYFITDSPMDHSTINETEKEYILRSVASEKGAKTPWLQILTSLRVWACVALVATADWLLTSYGAEIPEFLNDILLFDLAKDPVLSWVPYFLLALTTLLSSGIADILVRQEIVGITAQRKAAALMGIVPTTAFLIALNYVGCDRSLAIALMMMGFVCLGPLFSAAMTAALDLSRNHSGLIFGIAFTAGSLANLLIPVKAAGLIQTGATRDNFSKVVYSTVGVAIFLGLFYVIFGSGKRQTWDRVEKRTESSNADDGIEEKTKVFTVLESKPSGSGTNVNDSMATIVEFSDEDEYSEKSIEQNRKNEASGGMDNDAFHDNETETVA